MYTAHYPVHSFISIVLLLSANTESGFGAFHFSENKRQKMNTLEEVAGVR